MGTMMLTMTCWGSNVIVASTFLTQMENTTPSGAFGFYASICIVSILSLPLLPEHLLTEHHSSVGYGSTSSTPKSRA